ncbi:uncharacterized protein N7479_004115 [Penicillium vulpinum]|uniref:VIT domain-containing protein n=1 Tax=Penicillium vulpinum TaxID=29845 RepID=A0A1V6SC07_9EURO|nr:uncharacterized protein N7479_004115 [Penicillium vulpinum]KAJ5964239.1 hypothetical protein N7479_004115 [Penicillium vulpinum]OQE11531.1 hypothetical protein PENVUL_c002G03690 [Penicillium vulpinum]
MASYCGCLWNKSDIWQPQYLPQVSLKAHATILSSIARTTLTQIFVNPSDKAIEEMFYHFPLYDGVSVVGFECKVGSRLLHSKVKTKSQANKDYQNAVAQRQAAAVMDYTSMNDVFVIRLGNVPAHEKINVDITFVGELKQDAQTDGIRYTLPSTIAPRYGTGTSYSTTQLSPLGLPANLQGISITVDVQMEKGSVIRELESPSHRVKVSLGRVSSTRMTSSAFEPSHASASIIRQQNDASVVLGQDFVVLIKADGLDTPCALLERHPTIPNQQALMATLVPKFSLLPSDPEVVFVIDRSGSMRDKISTLKSALGVFLKSLPVGICFNICSFGRCHSFMWPTSQVYDESSLEQALAFVDTIDASMGGTEMRRAVIATVENRLNLKDLDVLILTDGQISDQDRLFDFVRNKAADNTARFFTLGIGEGASHSLIEGVARAGNGFCQSVTAYEELDRKVIRMLKGALTPHVHDYKLEIEYDTETETEFEFVSDTENFTDSETVVDKEGDGDISMEETTHSSLQPISLYDENFQEPDMDVDEDERAIEKLPNFIPPRAIQAPYNIPPLYPFIRTNVYLLLDPTLSEKTPKSLKLSATSRDGPLQLQIPICHIGTGETIHQLASRKAVIELEERHGWLAHSKDEKGNKFEHFHQTTKKRLAERECQDLGIKFQVAGKYCSFVALEECDSSSSEQQDEQHTPKEDTVEHFSSILESARFPNAARVRTGGSRSGGVFGSQRSSHSSRQAMPMQTSQISTGPGLQYEHAGALRFSSGVAPLRKRSRNSNSINQLAAFAAAPMFGQRSAISAGVPMSPNPTLPKTALMRMHELIRLQTFEGSWMWSNELFGLLECDKSTIINKLATLYGIADRITEDGFQNGSEPKVLATLLAIGWLLKKHSASRAVWELVSAKASDWVSVELKRMMDQGLPGAIIASIRDEIVDMV